MRKDTRRLQHAYRLAAYMLKDAKRPVTLDGLSDETGYPIGRVCSYLRRNREFCTSLGATLPERCVANDYRAAIRRSRMDYPHGKEQEVA